MYVDKKLGGVNAVQTLSRLNRTRPEKEDVFVLDFVNETDDIAESFQPYYTTTILSKETDPNILHDLQRDILNYNLFSEEEICDFVELYFKDSRPNVLSAFLDTMVERFEELEKEGQDECRKKIADFLKKYAFIAQIISFEDSSLEKIYIFLRYFKRKLPIANDPLPIDLLESIDLESIKIPKVGHTQIKLKDEKGLIEPIEGSGRGNQEDEQETLSKILKDVNDKFGTEFSDDDRVVLNHLTVRLMENKQLAGTIQNNAKDLAKIKFKDFFGNELISMFKSNFDLYEKLDTNPELKEYVNQKVFDYIHSNLSKK